MPAFCHGYRRNGLVLHGRFIATAMHGEKRNPLRQETSELSERAASHQQAIRLNHARDGVVHVWAYVENSRHPNHVERPRSVGDAWFAHFTFRAVIGHLRRQALRNLERSTKGRSYTISRYFPSSFFRMRNFDASCKRAFVQTWGTY